MKSPVFEVTYQSYLEQLSKIDLSQRSERLGVQLDRDALLIPFFNTVYRVSGEGIADDTGRKPDHAVSVVLSKYVLLCPEKTPMEDEWVSFRNFKNAAPFVSAFSTYTEQAIAGYFTRNLSALKSACIKNGGREPQKTYSYDAAFLFNALPKIPMMLLFNDSDDELPAAASVLFEKRAESFLDMECLAILGLVLADMLTNSENFIHSHR